jgi:hypothetical protein
MPRGEKIKFFYFSKFAVRIYNQGKAGGEKWNSLLQNGSMEPGG